MKRFGLIGRTLKHSFSKTYFTRKFEKEGLDCSYDNFELASISELHPLLTRMPALIGFNVTIPYKKEILPYLSFQDAVVQAIGACNCVKMVAGKCYGFNTDGMGFLKSLSPHVKPHHTQALVLGSGGSSAAVQYALAQLGISYKVVSRQPAAAQLSYNDITPEVLSAYTLIINTTPVGMFPAVEAAPALPYQLLTSRHLLYDLVYNPEKTEFLKKGEAQGATILNGYTMLLLQAEESWRIWNS